MHLELDFVSGVGVVGCLKDFSPWSLVQLKFGCNSLVFPHFPNLTPLCEASGPTTLAWRSHLVFIGAVFIELRKLSM